MWNLGLAVLAMLAVFVVLDVVFKAWRNSLSSLAPGWKNRIFGWMTMLSGAISAILMSFDPELLRPLIGDNPWAGVILFFVGALIDQLRTVTFTPGSNTPPDKAAASALATLAITPKGDVEDGLRLVEERVKRPEVVRWAKQISEASVKPPKG